MRMPLTFIPAGIELAVYRHLLSWSCHMPDNSNLTKFLQPYPDEHVLGPALRLRSIYSLADELHLTEEKVKKILGTFHIPIFKLEEDNTKREFFSLAALELALFHALMPEDIRADLSPLEKEAMVVMAGCLYETADAKLLSARLEQLGRAIARKVLQQKPKATTNA